MILWARRSLLASEVTCGRMDFYRCIWDLPILCVIWALEISTAASQAVSLDAGEQTYIFNYFHIPSRFRTFLETTSAQRGTSISVHYTYHIIQQPVRLTPFEIMQPCAALQTDAHLNRRLSSSMIPCSRRPVCPALLWFLLQCLMVFGDVGCERISRPEKFVIFKSWFAVCPSWGESAENIFDCAASAFATGPCLWMVFVWQSSGTFSCYLFQQLFLRRRGFMQTLPFSMLEPRTSAAGSRLQSKDAKR